LHILLLALYLSKKLKPKRILISILIIIFIATVLFLLQQNKSINDDRFVSYIVNPKEQQLTFYWKNDSNENFRNLENLKIWLKKNNKNLIFAMNGGMYKQDNSPQGLYIENHKILSPIDTTSGNGNFYLKPNGIFYLTNTDTGYISTTTNFHDSANIKYATQSGPMLLIDGEIHPAFIKGSTNINIRNGVGILANNHIIFAMSKKKINFYDFANYFKSMGCTNALYLDGYVSRTYLPEKKWIQTDGDFGVIIAVCNK
jgi:uncharacterized protein YigE (DUF2233 family)